MDYGVPRKSVALEWQKDLLRFLPKGQGDIKYQHVFSSQNKKRVCQNADTPSCFMPSSQVKLRQVPKYVLFSVAIRSKITETFGITCIYKKKTIPLRQILSPRRWCICGAYWMLKTVIFIVHYPIISLS